MGKHNMHKHHMHGASDKANMTTLSPASDKHDHAGHVHSMHDHSAHRHDMPDPSVHEHNMHETHMIKTTPAVHDMTHSPGHDMHVHNDAHNHHMHMNNITTSDVHAHHHDNSMIDSQHHQHAHPMTFHTRNDDYILFKDWQLSPGRVTFFVCLGLVVLAISYQAIKMIRTRLGRKCPNLQCKRYILSRSHILQSVTYVIQFLVGYALMLAVMTYNAWVMVAAVTGIGIGYFFFGWAEYEEIVRLKPLTARPSHRSVKRECGAGGDQELVPLSKDSTATDVTILTSNVACSCDQEL